MTENLFQISFAHLTNDKADVLKQVPDTVVKLKECTIEGSPKPIACPKYINYDIGKHESECIDAEKQDLILLVGRFINRYKHVNSNICI